MGRAERRRQRGVRGGVRLKKKFVADRMLGRLARYLRMLGYDVVYPGEGDDIHLVHIARRDRRILLTRDAHFAGRTDIRVVLITDGSIERQLKQVVEELRLRPDRVSSCRCTLCNGNLEEVSRRKVKDLVPEHVYLSHEKFWVCSSCGHCYWPGSHWENLMKKMGEREQRR
jgi:uncharacterized protein with PIN domain